MKLMTALLRSTVLPNFKVKKHRRAKLLPGNTILFLKNYIANSYTIETHIKGVSNTIIHKKEDTRQDEMVIHVIIPLFCAAGFLALKSNSKRYTARNTRVYSSKVEFHYQKP